MCDIIRQNTAMLSDQNGDVIRHNKEIGDVTRQISAMLSDNSWYKLSATLLEEIRSSRHVS